MPKTCGEKPRRWLPISTPAGECYDFFQNNLVEEKKIYERFVYRCGSARILVVGRGGIGRDPDRVAFGSCIGTRCSHKTFQGGCPLCKPSREWEGLHELPSFSTRPRASTIRSRYLHDRFGKDFSSRVLRGVGTQESKQWMLGKVACLVAGFQPQVQRDGVWICKPEFMGRIRG